MVRSSTALQAICPALLHRAHSTLIAHPRAPRAPPPLAARSLPPARLLPEKAVAAAAAEQRVAHKRKLQALLDNLEAENESILGKIEESRSQITSISMRIGTLYGSSTGQQLATVA